MVLKGYAQLVRFRVGGVLFSNAIVLTLANGIKTHFLKQPWHFSLLLQVFELFYCESSSMRVILDHPTSKAQCFTNIFQKSHIYRAGYFMIQNGLVGKPCTVLKML